MLDQEKIYQNKLKFMELLTKLNVDLTDFSKFLDAVDYYNKPASTTYFKAYQGGLCQYALDLYYELCQLVNAYAPGKYTEEDVIKVALFKDLYRAILYEDCKRMHMSTENGKRSKAINTKKIDRLSAIWDSVHIWSLNTSLILQMNKSKRLRKQTPESNMPEIFTIF